MKKLLTLFFTFVLVIGVVGIKTDIVKADPTIIQINDVAGLKAFLDPQNNETDGKLTGSNDYIISECLDVGGEKTLDLNGKTIKANDNFGENQLFKVNTNCVFTVIDNTKSESNPYGLGVIDGGYSETTKHSNFIRGFYIRQGGKLVIEAGTIKNMYVDTNRNFNGGAILNNGSLEMEGGLITDCHAKLGGAIYNQTINNYNANLTIKGGKIKSCTAEDGGAIYNDAFWSNKTAQVEIIGGIIENCDAEERGGAIYNHGVTSNNKIAQLTIGNENNGGTIENCKAKEGGAICSYFSYNTLIKGKISNCKSNYSAISHYGYEGPNFGVLHLNGNFIFDNKNNSGIKDDICISGGAKIILGSSFNTSSKIYIWNDFAELSVYGDAIDVITCGGYSVEEGKSLKDIFVSINAQEILTEEYTGVTDHSLSFKSVKIDEQPIFANAYTVDLNNNTSDIKTEYQWYKAGVLDNIQILDVGHYGTAGGQYSDFNVGIDNMCSGIYNNNETWTMPNTIVEGKNYLFNLTGLKQGQLLSFDFNADASTSNLQIALVDQNGAYGIAIPNNNIGTYQGVIPHDGDYLIFMCAINNNQSYTAINIKNIEIKSLNESTSLAGEIGKQLIHPEANYEIFLRVKYTNKESGAISYEDSKCINFGNVIDGDKQNIIKGTSKEVEIEIDVTDDEYDYFDGTDGAVYLDGLGTTNKLIKDTDYKYEKGSIILKLQSSLVSKLEVGKHSLYVKKSNESGKECSVATVNVVNPITPASVYVPVNTSTK